MIKSCVSLVIFCISLVVAFVSGCRTPILSILWDLFTSFWNPFVHPLLCGLVVIAKNVCTCACLVQQKKEKKKCVCLVLSFFPTRVLGSSDFRVMCPSPSPSLSLCDNK